MAYLLESIHAIAEVFHQYAQCHKGTFTLNQKEMKLLIQEEFAEAIKDPCDHKALDLALHQLEGKKGLIDFDEYLHLIFGVAKACYNDMGAKECLFQKGNTTCYFIKRVPRREESPCHQGSKKEWERTKIHGRRDADNMCLCPCDPKRGGEGKRNYLPQESKAQRCHHDCRSELYEWKDEDMGQGCCMSKQQTDVKTCWQSKDCEAWEDEEVDQDLSLKEEEAEEEDRALLLLQLQQWESDERERDSCQEAKREEEKKLRRQREVECQVEGENLHSPFEPEPKEGERRRRRWWWVDEAEEGKQRKKQQYEEPECRERTAECRRCLSCEFREESNERKKEYEWENLERENRRRRSQGCEQGFREEKQRRQHHDHLGRNNECRTPQGCEATRTREESQGRERSSRAEDLDKENGRRRHQGHEEGFREERQRRQESCRVGHLGRDVECRSLHGHEATRLREKCPRREQCSGAKDQDSENGRRRSEECEEVFRKEKQARQQCYHPEELGREGECRSIQGHEATRPRKEKYSGSEDLERENGRGSSQRCEEVFREERQRRQQCYQPVYPKREAEQKTSPRREAVSPKENNQERQQCRDFETLERDGRKRSKPQGHEAGLKKEVQRNWHFYEPGRRTSQAHKSTPREDGPKRQSYYEPEYLDCRDVEERSCQDADLHQREGRQGRDRCYDSKPLQKRSESRESSQGQHSDSSEDEGKKSRSCQVALEENAWKNPLYYRSKLFGKECERRKGQAPGAMPTDDVPKIKKQSCEDLKRKRDRRRSLLTGLKATVEKKKGSPAEREEGQGKEHHCEPETLEGEFGRRRPQQPEQSEPREGERRREVA